MDKLIEIIEKMEDEKLLNAYRHLLELDQENELVQSRIMAFRNELKSRGIERE